jgi:hypothetical protein
VFRSRPTLATVLAAAAVAIAAAAGCGPRANPPGSAATLAPAARVSSSIPDGAELTGPVRWEARVSGIPASGVAAVRFFIDGKLKYVARQAPYLFAGRGNLLLPGTLGPGSHVFAVDVTLTDGRRLTIAATAVVPAKAHGTPRQVLGRRARTVTAAQVARTRSFRNPADGILPPAGTWQVRIGADGVARYTAPAPTHDVAVGEVRFEPGRRLAAGNQIPDFPHASNGGFCAGTAGGGIYHRSLQGHALTVRAVSDHQCAGRNSVWNGTFA